MDAATGRPLAGTAHLAQSIGRILTTPIGSRVGLRSFGSALFDLLDGPLTPVTRLRLFAAVAIALATWEPRLRLTRVGFDATGAADGRATLTIEGRRTDDPAPTDLVRLTIPLSPSVSRTRA